MEEKKIDKLDIMRLEKKIGNLEIENKHLERMSMTMQNIPTEMREKTSLYFPTRQLQTEESDMGAPCPTQPDRISTARNYMTGS